MIAFDDRQAPAWFQDPPKFKKRFLRTGQVFEHETDEDVLEGMVGKGQAGAVGLPEVYRPQAQFMQALFGRGQGGRCNIHCRNKGPGAASRQDGGLSARAAAGFQHPAAGREAGIVMKKVFERAGLVVQAPGFHRIIAMYVR